mgnify:CR=1 FL=1
MNRHSFMDDAPRRVKPPRVRLDAARQAWRLARDQATASVTAIAMIAPL